MRNPALLGDVSPNAAAEALRESLPGVDPAVVSATAEALAASDATRQAFERDREAARVLGDFANAWAGHVTDVLGSAHKEAVKWWKELEEAREEARSSERELGKATDKAGSASVQREKARTEQSEVQAHIRALEKCDAYDAARNLDLLEQRRTALQGRAEAEFRALERDTTRQVRTGKRLRRDLESLDAEIDEQVRAAQEADARAHPREALLSWADRPRATFPVGNRIADPGPAITVTGGPDRLRSAASAWATLADEHRRNAERAEVAVNDYERGVRPKEDKAKVLTTESGQIAERYDASVDRLETLARRAGEQVASLHGSIQEWGGRHPDIAPEIDRSAPTGDPAQFLATAEEWADTVRSRAVPLVSDAKARARHHGEAALTLTRQAEDCRRRAAELRSDRLLPFPRPQWAGEVDDTTAFGSALDWRAEATDEAARAAIEVALADAGLLSAALTPAGTRTDVWRIAPTGHPAACGLDTVLAVDPVHPYAAEALEVLRRIELAPTALAAPSGSVLVIGRDGSFAAGPLIGDRLAAPEGSTARPPAPTAVHVGAHRRRAAARERAAELDRQATELVSQAEELQAKAHAELDAAERITTAVDTFPRRTELRKAEADRASQAVQVAELRIKRDQSHVAAVAAERDADQARREWAGRVRAMGLVVELDSLAKSVAASRDTARALTGCVQVLERGLIRRADAIVTDVEEDDATTRRLRTAHGDALSSYREAEEVRVEIVTLRERLGSDIEAVLHDLEQARHRSKELERALPDLDRAVEETIATRERMSARVDTAHKRVQDAEPEVAAAAGRLRELLEVPGVLATLADGSAADLLQRVTPPEALIDKVGGLLAGHRGLARHALLARYDAARAELAGVWTLEHGNSHGPLDTFVITHGDAVYTPVAATRRAGELARQAEDALRVAEDEALRSFILQRLPAAVAVAWTRLNDWKRDVNRKMRAASASSGVGVQVEIAPIRDMAPAVRTVYELACRGNAADRTDEQRVELGRALRSLIDAADGDTMEDKVTNAIDVRDWVNVNYVVTRAGQQPKTWTSRTGLSGGERRLVVLAPMLAAVAATYDGFGSDGLRLATLDEVPAEVDEAGREGLARYLAELDLDILCTSYLWDGAPGAWDGIDAWDFEGDESGTVVAFPMLMRDLNDLPDDSAYFSGETGAAGDG
ncbi:SbcC/MukB-like Walker B domain-containing protein [Actinomadura rupiterrae]|uniref:SbcC/MukB-like Walker B domain-containing protein n=1 Tax=Actinomadura rupiterrae TaxID=559627 RepID=UPI0020A44CDB|nr:SbcC/MukB-like Walker B domain-containing protein [Actinomadura rupiterrae]MCP2342995.1 hypothetical protein [Actinomadura rupiterrae]